VAQLTVPVIALAGGTSLLGEVPSLRLPLAGAVVLGGVAVSLSRARAARAA
jgi:drug/metabolite transporter (DMT)-like permease